nr:putative potassium transporter 12 [Ipomoea batatas]
MQNLHSSSLEKFQFAGINSSVTGMHWNMHSSELGTGMHIPFNGNLNLEPNCLRVVSAVSGLQGKIPGFGTNDHVITSVVILGASYSIQPFGSSKVAGFTFAPGLAIWFFSLGSIGNNVC